MPRGGRPIRAHRPVTASAAKSAAWTTLSTPGGAKGTPSAGVKSTAREIRTTTAKVPRERKPWTWSAVRIGRESEPVEIGLAIGPDHGQARLAGEQLGGDVADLCLVHGVDPGQDLAHRQVLPVGQLALAEPAHTGTGVLQSEDQAALEL